MIFDSSTSSTSSAVPGITTSGVTFASAISLLRRSESRTRPAASARVWASILPSCQSARSIGWKPVQVGSSPFFGKSSSRASILPSSSGKSATSGSMRS